MRCWVAGIHDDRSEPIADLRDNVRVREARKGRRRQHRERTLSEFREDCVLRIWAR